MPLEMRSLPTAETVQDRLQRVIDLHFDPQHGSAYWLDRAARFDIDARRQVRSVDDLALLGETTPGDLASRPLLDFVPRALHGRLDQLVVAQTGGTTGGGHWTAYRSDEFEEAFVTPFVAAANHVGFPRDQQWLFVGPSGPHIIGKAMRHLAAAMGSPDPFSVDFDPRWVKKLPEGSFARRRYVEHVVEQAMAVLDSQPVTVLFTTPPVLEALAARMSAARREAIAGVHYGGMALDAAQLQRFQTELFPSAVHLSGYGNTLFGCCLELDVTAGRAPTYYPYGNRLILETIDESGDTAAPDRVGRVRFTRLDETMLIVRYLERDSARLIAPPREAPDGFELPGVVDPRFIAAAAPTAAVGIY